MSTTLTKKIDRELPVVYRGRRMVARFAPEGTYIKLKGERWSSAYLVPYEAQYSVGAKMKAADIAREKKLKRELSKR